MTITVKDASNYFRGLLLLIRKDRKISQPEIDLMKRIGKRLGFEKEFCENAIGEILENPHVVDEPPHFSTKELAIKFVKDGLALAFADAEVHPREEQWLRSTAEENGIDVKVFSEEWENARNRKGYPSRLEVDDVIVKFSP
jgi:hypothetical protein